MSDQTVSAKPNLRTVYLKNYGLNVNVPSDYNDDDIDAAVAKFKPMIEAQSPVFKANAARIAAAAQNLGITPQAAHSQGVGPAMQQAQAQREADRQASEQQAQRLQDQLTASDKGDNTAGMDTYFTPNVPPLSPSAIPQAKKSLQQAVAKTQALGGFSTDRMLSTPLLAPLLDRVAGPGTTAALESTPGYGAGLAKGLMSFTSPGSLATLAGLAPLGAAPLVGKLALAGFGAQALQGAAQQAGQGDYGGALGGLTAFALPFGLHAIGENAAGQAPIEGVAGLPVHGYFGDLGRGVSGDFGGLPGNDIAPAVDAVNRMPLALTAGPRFMAGPDGNIVDLHAVPPSPAFEPTHTIGETPVVEKLTDLGNPYFENSAGARVKPNRDAPAVPIESSSPVASGLSDYLNQVEQAARANLAARQQPAPLDQSQPVSPNGESPISTGMPETQAAPSPQPVVAAPEVPREPLETGLSDLLSIRRAVDLINSQYPNADARIEMSPRGKPTVTAVAGFDQPVQPAAETGRPDSTAGAGAQQTLVRPDLPTQPTRPVSVDPGAISMQGPTESSTVMPTNPVSAPVASSEVSPIGESVPARPGALPSVAEVDPRTLLVDPERFQYKQAGANTARGVSGSLRSVDQYNPDLAGVLSVWRDPADGQTYITNGHNRLDLALRSGAPKVAVRYIDAPDASTARYTGAMQNIAEGMGTPIDAAKIFREKGVTPQQLRTSGVSLSGKMASDGLALSRLDDFLFRQVAQGTIPESRGIAIGRAEADPAAQRALYGLIERAERSGKRLSDADILQLAHEVRNAPTVSEDTSGSLFGDDFSSQQNLAVEKAQLAASVRQRLGEDRTLFGRLTNEGKAQRLARGGNDINTVENARLAGEAARNVESFDQARRLNSQVIDRDLNDAAVRIHQGENPTYAREQLYHNIVRSLQEADTGGDRSLPQGSLPGAAGRSGLLAAEEGRAAGSAGNSEASTEASHAAGTEVSDPNAHEGAAQQTVTPYRPYGSNPATLTRSFTAGSHQARITFEDALQRDLYDLASKERYQVRGGQNKTSDRPVGDLDGLRNHLAQHLGTDPAEVSRLAGSVRDDVNAQMKGVRDGEERRVTNNVLRDQAAPPSRLDAIEQAARDRLQNRSRGLQSGIDPDDLRDMAIIGAVKIARGAVTLADFSKQMVADFGDAIKPHLQDLYTAALDHYHSQIAPRFNLPRVDEAARPAATSGKPVEQPQRFETARSIDTRQAAPPEASTRVEPQRAANINLDRLNTGEEVKAAVQDQARQLASQIEQARGGKISHAETEAAARDLGLTPAQLKAVAPGERAAYAVALRQLLVRSAEDLRQAEQAFRSSPTQENAAALDAAARAHQTVLLGAAGNAAEAGRALSSYRILAGSLRADPAAAADAIFKTPSPSEPLPKYSSDAYGSANRLFTKDAADAARQRLASNLGKLNAGIDPTMLKDLLTLGGYHLEAGLREFGQWAVAMRKETGGKVSDADLRQVWSQLRPEAQQRAQEAVAKDAVRDKLLRNMNVEDAARLASDLAQVKPDDFAGLNRVVSKYGSVSLLDKISALRKVGLLSGPATLGKIAAAHGSYLGLEEAARIPASLADMALSAYTGNDRTIGGVDLGAMRTAAMKAATQGVADAKTILQSGQGGLALKRLQTGQTDPVAAMGRPFAEVGSEFHSGNRLLDAYSNGVMRVHGAAYEVMKQFALHRALSEQARLGAMQEASVMRKAGRPVPADFIKTRQAQLLQDPTDPMVASAIEAAEEATFINDTKFTQANKAVRNIAGPGGRFALDLAAPFTKVPSNVIARLLEYSGVASPGMVARGILARADITPEMQGQMARTFGRHATGWGVMALGYLLAKQGLLTGTLRDRQHGESGSLQLAGHPIRVDNVSPVGNLLATGANLAQMEHSNSRLWPKQAGTALVNSLREQPLLSGVENVSALLEGAQRGDIRRPVGQTVGSFVPTISAQVAGLLDSTPRRERNLLDYTKARVPLLRNTLPAGRGGSGSPTFFNGGR